MTSTTTSTINLFDNEYNADTLSVVDRLTGEIVAQFLCAAGVAVYFDDQAVEYEWAFPFSDARTDKATVCNFCNIDPQFASLRWNI